MLVLLGKRHFGGKILEVCIQNASCKEIKKIKKVCQFTFKPGEVEEQNQRLKANKAAGHDGLSPGVFKLVDEEWIYLITYLFNQVFSGHYPDSWNYLNVFNIHKKGPHSNPKNYRGISVMAALAKLYDMVLAARFSLWYRPRLEQAGAQKGRGGEEQTLAVRLLIDTARKTNIQLYICFVDYQKAYDKVDRFELLQKLDQHGCGSRYLRAIAESLKHSTGIIG